MKKKLTILLGVLLGVILIFIILCFTLFSLSAVSLDWRNRPIALAGSDQQILESGGFNIGQCVLFSGKSGYVQKLERANPYLKVVNIETVFPNKYVVHCVERSELYAIPLNDKTYICDNEYKVLQCLEQEEYEQRDPADKLIDLKGLRVQNSLAEPGEFLVVDNGIDLYSAFLENNRSCVEQKALIKSIEIGVRADKNLGEEDPKKNPPLPYAKITLHDGQTYMLLNAKYATTFKVGSMILVYSHIFELIGQPIDSSIVDEEHPLTQENTWTADKLKQSVIEINNFYLETDEHPYGSCRIDILPPDDQQTTPPQEENLPENE